MSRVVTAYPHSKHVVVLCNMLINLKMQEKTKTEDNSRG